MIFWNVAGIANKDKEFWEYIRKFDFVSLSETWIEEQGWRKWENKLAEEFVWRSNYAKKEERRGRAKGGIIIGIRKEWIKGGQIVVKEEEGIILSRLRLEKE